MNLRYIICFVLFLMIISCSGPVMVAGYYQGTYSSNDPAHPYGNVVVNISESNSSGVDIHFLADGYPNIHLNNVQVTSKTEYFITTYYFSYYDGVSSLSGSGDMSGTGIHLKYSYDVSQYHYIMLIEAHE